MLFADLDPSLAQGGVGALVIALITIVLKHLSGERQTQRDHEVKMADRQEVLAKEMADRQESLVTATQETFKEIQKEVRDEARKTTTVLLNIQKETITTLGELGHEVENLGSAISEMRVEMSKKADRPPSG